MSIKSIKKLNQQIDEKLNDKLSICKKGCSACCYQLIEVTTYEKEGVLDYIANQLDDVTKEKVKSDLISWLDIFDANTPSKNKLTGKEVFDEFQKFAARHSLKCPFLQDDICSIYDMRPMTCRVHYVTDKIDLCEKDRLRDSAPKGIELRSKIMRQIKKSGGLFVEPLPYLAAEILIPERSLKIIYKNKII